MQIFGQRCQLMLNPHEINREKYKRLIFMLVHLLKKQLLDGGIYKERNSISLQKGFGFALSGRELYLISNYEKARS
jgi:hypothetical protein